MLKCRKGNCFLGFVSLIVFISFSTISLAENSNKEKMPESTKNLFYQKCSPCHRPQVVNKLKNRPEKDWAEIINKMRDGGAKINNIDGNRIASYLAKNIK